MMMMETATGGWTSFKNEGNAAIVIRAASA